MNLKILLPFAVFTEKTGIVRIIAETDAGSFGFLPNRLDCVAVLVPGIFVFETEGKGETYLAVDEGILIKTGTDVLVAVRKAIEGVDLATLREVVSKEFSNMDAQEQSVRQAVAKMESGFIRRFAEFFRE
ncbi:F0F1 ATP synthase subunit epsilon [Nitrosovibrio tenuis]|uniref:F-type H+-transporting ATPase subunit epsilon n=1 Tax=Nitrosovibrio tenuis TaxID=1233 RepID=A0A1H7I1N9_9PROT|nr:F0F1 ATP synthase subunit epsilon [Nitrosovibrio tenuis]SEK56449.1 F-type H+-transporting ATPase subunit epsilon [Nitrosovibrio tenuis]